VAYSEIPTASKDAIASDIEVALNNNSASALEVVSRGSLLAMKAKLEQATGQEAKAITDLEAAISANEESPYDIFNNGGVKPGDYPSSTCMWTEADLDGLVKSFPADYRVYFFRGLFYSFFATYDEPSILKAQENIQRAIQLNKSGSGPLHFYLADVEIHSHFFKRMGSESVRKAGNPAILKELDQAIELAPNFKPALGARAERELPVSVRDGRWLFLIRFS
jgi:tetratricopeptide (TPR) repeat protein